ncbi:MULTISPECIES: VOC family protein [unclassified Microbacterium]|uniref:VOC family protein n=1 Tax=unclassified Microbacterium TaxID=2609290 RepID=UPI00214B63C7|nr:MULTISPECIES: VOC family protein [unclassified Microbacterium]MCR2784534.1 VOC family protein [Microbacterium sp. zg.B96]MDL5350545.1 VOC family protein [Microbacterium sp. zg-YB36]WIM14655.1 VOC family protein [Microbacterium sp. zg-B96]
MQAKAVTIGVPVRDLERAVDWYQNAFELAEPDLRPLDGLAEFNLGSFWLQLAFAPELAGVDGISANISVEDARGEHRRLNGLGLEVSPIQRFEGVVEFFELTDLDGNKIGFVTELS